MIFEACRPRLGLGGIGTDGSERATLLGRWCEVEERVCARVKVNGEEEEEGGGGG